MRTRYILLVAAALIAWSDNDRICVIVLSCCVLYSLRRLDDQIGDMKGRVADQKGGMLQIGIHAVPLSSAFGKHTHLSGVDRSPIYQGDTASVG